MAFLKFEKFLKEGDGNSGEDLSDSDEEEEDMISDKEWEHMEEEEEINEVNQEGHEEGGSFSKLKIRKMVRMKNSNISMLQSNVLLSLVYA